MTVMALNNSQWKNDPLPCASAILNPDRLSFSDELRSRIASFLSSNRIIRLRSLVLLALDDAQELHQFLQKTLATVNRKDFAWEMISDSQAEQLRQVLSAYLDIYRKVDSLQQAGWLLMHITALHRYMAITRHNTGMISEILVLLDEDRADVLAAHAALNTNEPNHSLEDIMQELGLAA